MRIVDYFRGQLYISELLALKLTVVSAVIFFGLLLIIGILIIEFFFPVIKIESDISGPLTSKAGELVTYTVTYKNTGGVSVSNPKLVFVYSTHSFPEKGELMEIVQADIFGDVFHPKEEKTFQFKARLFGKKGEKIIMKHWLSYDDNQISEVGTFSTQISEIPIDLELDLPPGVPIFPEARSDFRFRVRYASFIDYPLSDLKVNVIYPGDFSLKETRPEGIQADQWEIATLGKNETGEIEIFGEFPEGQEIGEEMSFAATLSISMFGEEVLLKETEKRAVTFEPVVFISQTIDGKADYIPLPGERLHYEISFHNIQNEPLRDLTLISVLEGNLYDLFSIEVRRGEVKPGDNSIIWTGEKTFELRYLQPGEEGKVEFWVNLKPDYEPKNISEINTVITNVITMGEFEKEFRTKVNSNLDIEQEGYYGDKYGFFENIGFPPTVNKTTSYTIVWRIKNLYNLIQDVKVRASLPPEVNVKSIRPPTQGTLNIAGEFEGLESAFADIPPDFRFENILSFGMQSDDVKYLQLILKKEVPNAYRPSTPATGFFGTTTFNALIEFQKKYGTEILRPQGLSTGNGFIDEFSRLKLNELLTEGGPTTSRELVWEIERLDPGLGALSDPLLASFQITLTPTLTQKGKVAELISEVTMSGRDQWTGQLLFARDDSIDTTLPDDLTVKEGEIR